MRKSNNTISEWLEQYGDLEIDYFIEKNLLITEKVRKAKELKGWSNVDLSKAMGVDVDVINKWLSGMYDLTLKNIVKLEKILEIEIIKNDE